LFGFAFLKNHRVMISEPTEDNLEQEVAPPEERARLRSRLSNGPEEFREDRVDRPKGK
jgi:hypothetical protein